MPIVDLSFRLIGQTIPLDHGYGLFAALCRIVPELHGDLQIGVHPIRGRQTARGVLALVASSRLKLRLPADQIAPYIAVAGSELEIDGHRLRVGIPRVEALTPSPNLGARLVTFRHALDPARFEADIHRELARLEVSASANLVPSSRPGWEGQPLRRVLTIKGRRIVGYALRITSLTPEGSLKLQENGLGGRRRFGCGVLVPFESAPR